MSFGQKFLEVQTSGNLDTFKLTEAQLATLKALKETKCTNEAQQQFQKKALFNLRKIFVFESKYQFIATHRNRSKLLEAINQIDSESNEQRRFELWRNLAYRCEEIVIDLETRKNIQEKGLRTVNKELYDFLYAGRNNNTLAGLGDPAYTNPKFDLNKAAALMKDQILIENKQRQISRRTAIELKITSVLSGAKNSSFDLTQNLENLWQIIDTKKIPEDDELIVSFHQKIDTILSTDDVSQKMLLELADVINKLLIKYAESKDPEIENKSSSNKVQSEITNLLSSLRGRCSEQYLEQIQRDLEASYKNSGFIEFEVKLNDYKAKEKIFSEAESLNLIPIGARSKEDCHNDIKADFIVHLIHQADTKNYNPYNYYFSFITFNTINVLKEIWQEAETADRLLGNEISEEDMLVLLTDDPNKALPANAVFEFHENLNAIMSFDKNWPALSESDHNLNQKVNTAYRVIQELKNSPKQCPWQLAEGFERMQEAFRNTDYSPELKEILAQTEAYVKFGKEYFTQVQITKFNIYEAIFKELERNGHILPGQRFFHNHKLPKNYTEAKEKIIAAYNRAYIADYGVKPLIEINSLLGMFDKAVTYAKQQSKKITFSSLVKSPQKVETDILKKILTPAVYEQIWGGEKINLIDLDKHLSDSDRAFWRKDEEHRDSQERQARIELKIKTLKSIYKNSPGKKYKLKTLDKILKEEKRFPIALERFLDYYLARENIAQEITSDTNLIESADKFASSERQDLESFIAFILYNYQTNTATDQSTIDKVKRFWEITNTPADEMVSEKDLTAIDPNLAKKYAQLLEICKRVNPAVGDLDVYNVDTLGRIGNCLDKAISICKNPHLEQKELAKPIPPPFTKTQIHPSLQKELDDFLAFKNPASKDMYENYLIEIQSALARGDEEEAQFLIRNFFYETLMMQSDKARYQEGLDNNHLP